MNGELCTHTHVSYTHAHLRTIYAITISASASFKSQKNTVLSWCTIMPQPQQHRCYILLLKQATTSTASIAQPSCYSPSLFNPPTTVEAESCCCCCLHLRISTLRLMYEHIYTTTQQLCMYLDVLRFDPHLVNFIQSPQCISSFPNILRGWDIGELEEFLSYTCFNLN